MFFESIKLLDGEFYNLGYYQERVNRTLKQFFPKAKIRLEDFLEATPAKGLFKIRVNYSNKVNDVQTTPYEIKSHRKLKIIGIGKFDYEYKFENRLFFEKRLAENTGFDDLLLTKNNLLTDTTYCNIALRDGKNWFTPKSCLLCGTKRAALLNQGILFETELDMESLNRFSEIAFINAMRDFEKKYTFVLNGKEMILTEI